jgi:copper chaperone CopZ
MKLESLKHVKGRKEMNMYRRNFIESLTLAAAIGGTAAASDTRTVTYQLRGFSCITCAVGLDTMLGRQKGVIRSRSSYRDAVTRIEFEPSVVTEEGLKTFISEMGFTAVEIRRED